MPTSTHARIAVPVAAPFRASKSGPDSAAAQQRALLLTAGLALRSLPLPGTPCLLFLEKRAAAPVFLLLLQSGLTARPRSSTVAGATLIVAGPNCIQRPKKEVPQVPSSATHSIRARHISRSATGNTQTRAIEPCHKSLLSTSEACVAPPPTVRRALVYSR